MTVAVIGSRSLTVEDIAKYMPDGMTVLLSGGSKGIEKSAEQYADKFNMRKLILKAEYYKEHGNKARLVSYEHIIDECEFLIVIWDRKSSSTKYAVDYAKKTGRRLNVHIIDNV